MKFLTKTFYAFSVLLLLSVAGLFLASMLPIPGNIEIKIVKSGSMEPTIPTGSLVVIKPVESYALRDVITFGEDSSTQIPTTHRIIATREENGTLFSTKGDANEDPDTKEIRKAEIIGKVVTHVPYAGFVLDFAKKPLGFLLLIGIPAATIIIDELINIFREVHAAWRQRNRKGGERGGGGPFEGTLDSHIVYSRRCSMDDIFVPLRVLKARATRRLVSQRQYINASASIIAVFAVISLSSGGTASTLSYFRDTESSAQNIFGAGEWATSTQPLIDLDNTARFFSIIAQDGEVLGEDTSTDDPVPEQPKLDPEQVDTPSDEPTDPPAEPTLLESIPTPPTEESPPPLPELIPPALQEPEPTVPVE